MRSQPNCFEVVLLCVCCYCCGFVVVVVVVVIVDVVFVVVVVLLNVDFVVHATSKVDLRLLMMEVEFGRVVVCKNSVGLLLVLVGKVAY